MILSENFFKEDAITVAKELIGKKLIRKIDNKIIETKIVETEAYMGPEDKASHAYGNKKTKRTVTMFKRGGIAYIYLIYGMYYCFNIVTANEGKPEAVLIRAVEPLSELEIIKSNRDIKSEKKEDLTNGPGKLCQALQINKKLNGINLTANEHLYIKEDEENNFEIGTGKRINIDYAEEYKDKLWRFYLKGSSFLSK
ncbi:MAG TPA: DNA-3-methyladenine glycosylase [Halanaerobiales bacterium]|nr:DNA-3-methyladenine glycosylase [Halanaerobiales bacterium]